MPADLGDPGALATVPFARVTHVVHAAVDAGSSTQQARAVNLDGTLALAQRARDGGRLRRFLHVGSAWICGAGARGVVGEDDAPTPEPVSAYLVHKRAAEMALEGLPGLPLMIARPSLVMGHTRLGCEPSASLFWVLRLLDQLDSIPWGKHHRLDVVPVDWVAGALAHLLFTTSPAHRRCHLSAGPGGSVSWEDILRSFGGAEGRRSAPGETRVSLSDWAAAAAADPRVGARLSPSVLLGCLRFLEGDAVFDDARARELGVPAAPRLTDYLAICRSRDGGRTVAEQALDDR